MPYIVTWQEQAIAAGVSLPEAEVVFAVSAGQIADLYNQHLNDLNGQDPEADDAQDYWDNLTQDQKDQYIAEATQVISKIATNWDEEVRNTFPEV